MRGILWRRGAIFVLLPYGVVSFFFSFFNFPKVKRSRFGFMINLFI